MDNKKTEKNEMPEKNDDLEFLGYDDDGMATFGGVYF